MLQYINRSNIALSRTILRLNHASQKLLHTSFHLEMFHPCPFPSLRPTYYVRRESLALIFLLLCSGTPLTLPEFLFAPLPSVQLILLYEPTTLHWGPDSNAMYISYSSSLSPTPMSRPSFLLCTPILTARPERTRCFIAPVDRILPPVSFGLPSIPCAFEAELCRL